MAVRAPRSFALAALTALMIGCGIVDVRPDPLARNCSEWMRLDEDQRLQTAEALVDDRLLPTVREVQELPLGATDRDAFIAVRASVTKVCEVERRPGLQLADVIASLYE